MLKTIANVSADTQFFIVVNEIFNLRCSCSNVFVIFYPVFQVIAVKEKRIDFILVVIRFEVM